MLLIMRRLDANYLQVRWGMKVSLRAEVAMVRVVAKNLAPKEHELLPFKYRSASVAWGDARA